MSNRWQTFVFLSLVLAGCREDDNGPDNGSPDVGGDADGGGADTGGGNCGAFTCGDLERCDESSGTPRCVCRVGYAGDDCASCAPGYAMDEGGSCAPVAIDCFENPDICGAYGGCDFEDNGAAGTLFSCVCQEGYAGRYCERCAEGYQDNGIPGRCVAGCALSEVDCTAPQVCVDSTGVPQCGCPVGTTGAECNQCDLGYAPDGAGGCAALCGVEGSERCGTCPPGRTGPGCTLCAPGYVDVEGQCQASCETIEELGGCAHGDCLGGDVGVCDCDPGWAGQRCTSCRPGHIGDDCEACDYGWMRVGDEPCVASCIWNLDVCGDRAYCWDQENMQAECYCDPGYAGADCATCDDGFALAEGECLPQLGDDERFFTIAFLSDRNFLAVVDAQTGGVRPIRRLDVVSEWSSAKLAYDEARNRIYARGENGLVWHDPLTFAATTIVETLESSYMPVVAYDSERDLIYVVEGETLVGVDPENGDLTDLASLEELGSINEIVYDHVEDRLLIGHFGIVAGEFFITAVNLDDFEITPVSSMPSDFPLYGSNQIGFAVEDNGDLWMAGPGRFDPEDQQIEGCRVQAFRLTGLEQYRDAPGKHVLLPDGDTVTVTSDRDGPEVIALDYFASNNTIDIATSNGEAVICMPSYFFEGNTLRVSASAQFLAVISSSSAVPLVVEDGFLGSDSPMIHVGLGEAAIPHESLVSEPLVRLYTEEEWQSRRLGGSGFALESWQPNTMRRARVVRATMDFTEIEESFEVQGMMLTGLARRR